jgi:putative oxidoreductase
LELGLSPEVFIVSNVNQINENVPFYHVKTIDYSIANSSRTLGTVGGFGEFLDSKGFLIGVPLAWGITVFEIAGGAVMAWGLYASWIAAVFMIELTIGIFLVHLPNGWFVVGASQGGMEYSVLLLFTLIVISAHHGGERQVVG